MYVHVLILHWVDEGILNPLLDIAERPLHSTDNPHAVVKAWWNWPESYRKQACLCLKPTADLMLKLSKMVTSHDQLFDSVYQAKLLHPQD